MAIRPHSPLGPLERGLIEELASRLAEEAFKTRMKRQDVVRYYTPRPLPELHSGADIPALLGQALRSNATLIRPGARGRYVFEHTFEKTIGVSDEGFLTGRLRAVLEPSGYVVTAFPF